MLAIKPNLHGSIKTMTISLVIPVYNEEGEIGNCLDAVLAQTVPFNEIIVVDNNSSDRSMDVVKKYPAVKIISEAKQGVDFARDAGFNAAIGDIIGRIDADTYLPPDWSSQLLKIFSDEKIGAVSGPAFYKDLPAPAVSRKWDTIVRGTASKLSGTRAFLFGTNMAITRKAWEKVRNEVCHIKSLHEDIDLGIHVDEAGMEVAFDKDLIVGMSMRRVNDGPSDFYKYLHMIIDTYAHHGIDIRYLAYPNIALFMIMYPGMHLMKRAYDPKTNRISIKKFLHNEEIARKNPMA